MDENEPMGPFKNEGEPPGLVCNEMTANEREPKSD